MFRKGQLFVSLLLAVIVIVLNAGCPASDSGIPPISTTKNYGPPFYDIVFLDGQDFIGTVSSEGGTQATYLENVGSGSTIPSPGVGVLCKINSRSLPTEFFVKNNDNSTIELLDQLGVSKHSFENAVGSLYNISTSKLAYVQPVENGYTLNKYALTNYASDIHGSISSPEEYVSRPSFNSDGRLTVISIKNFLLPDYDRIVVGDIANGERDSFTVQALSPQFSPRNSDLIAYLDAPNGAEMVNQLVIMDSGLENEVARFNFPMGLSGATTFSWSPDDVRIALFVNVYGSEPELVVFNINDSTITPTPLSGYTPAIGYGEDLTWAYPSWNEESTALALCVKDGETYSIIIYNLIDESILPVMTGLTAPTHVEWREYTN